MAILSRIVSAIVRGPLLWGAALTIAFYAAIESGSVGGDLVRRYFDGHPIARLAVFLFFVGMASLSAKLIRCAWEWLALRNVALGPVLPSSDSTADVRQLAHSLRHEVALWRNCFIISRLQNALDFLQRGGASRGLDEELDRLADDAAFQSQQSYALIRVIVWAIPILGFLGTVIGITMAIAKLSPAALEESMAQVTSGLAVAFDTTALALGLSMVLMFYQFIVDRSESVLLTAIHDRARSELLGRFPRTDGTSNPTVAAVEQMCRAVVAATEELVVRQAAVWKETVREAHLQWVQVASSSKDQLREALGESLVKGLDKHAQVLADAESKAAGEAREYWGDVRATLDGMVRAISAQHKELTRQSDVLANVIRATDQIDRLESSLNANLASLSSTQDLQEAIVSLAASVNLLRAHLGQTKYDAVQLARGSDHGAPHAA